MAKELSEEGEKYCILIIGDTGSGKSSTGNTILGNLLFPVAKGLKTETKKAKAQTFGNMTVIDTPTITPVMTDEEAEVESREWLKEAGVKPDAIVLTINCRNRFTPEEYNLYCRYKSLFRNIIESRLLVLFTRGDMMTEEKCFNPYEVDNLKNIINDAGGRYLIYDNKTKDNAKQKKNLLIKLKAISEQNKKDKGEDSQEYGNRNPSVADGPSESDMATPQKKRRVLLVIGKSGTGKSSTGNTILGMSRFKTARGLKTQTREAQVYSNDEFEVIDTPDIPLNISPKQQEEEVKRWLERASAIPNAILLTINADEEYSHEDVEIFEIFQRLLERCNVCENLVIVFTRGDLIDRSDFEKSLKGDQGDPVRVVLKAACGRYVIFDNNTKEAHEKIEQLKTLSEKIEQSRRLPKRPSLKEREQAAVSVPTQPMTTCTHPETATVQYIQQPACQFTPSLKAESATSRSSEEDIRVLVMGAQHEARDKVYASLRKRKCDKKEWFGRIEAESNIFKVINCTLLLDGLEPQEWQLEYQEILHISNPGPHAILFVAAIDDNFSEANYKAFEWFFNTFRNINTFLMIVLVCSESSGGIDQTCIRSKIKEKLKSDHQYLTKILKMKNDEFLPFNFTKKADDMNNQVCYAFQWILSTVTTNNRRYFDNNEACKLIQNLNKNACERMDTGLSYLEQASNCRKLPPHLFRSNSKEYSLMKQPEIIPNNYLNFNFIKCLCHIL